MTRTERGSAIVELTWLGILLLIPLVYVVLSVMTVQRHAYGATEAARSAGRAFVLAPDVHTAQVRALAAARLAMRDQGLALDPAELTIDCHPSPAACLQPGSSAEVRIQLHVRLPLAPTMFGRQTGTVSIEATHTAVYGSYREAPT